MNIEKVANGYIVSDGPYGQKSVFQSLDEVFSYLLETFEGRSETFCGSSYGKVAINRKEPCRDPR